MKEELILEIIRERWSPVSFSSMPVEEYKLKAMFQAAGRAPSSNNEQPWQFVFTTRENGDIFDDFLGFLTESNREWAQYAYALVITMARTIFTYKGRQNRYALYDTGMAVSNLLTQALSMDIYVHQMGGFSVEKVKKYFKLKEEIEPVTMMAVGYLGDGTSLRSELLKKDETRTSRKSVNEIVFRDMLINQAF